MKLLPDSDNNILIKYFAVWGWAILSFLFLGIGIILIAIPRTLFSIVFGIAFICISIICTVMSQIRKLELYRDDDE